MSNYLDLPSDLQNLIEKRELDDRRTAECHNDGEDGDQEIPTLDRREVVRREEDTRRGVK